jgi:C4-dicarboxylate transporter DctM subunit
MNIDLAADQHDVTLKDDYQPRADTRLRKLENAINLIALLLLGALPIAEIITRLVFKAGIPDAEGFVKNFVLLVGFLGGMLAAREGQHLSIAAVSLIRSESAQRVLGTISQAFAVTFTTALTVSSLEWWLTAFGAESALGVVPLQVFAAVVPIAYLVMLIRFIITMPRSKALPAVVTAAILLGLALAIGSFTNWAFNVMMEVPEFIYALDGFWFSFTAAVKTPFLIILIASAFVGTPLFIVLTGSAFLLFAGGQGIIAVVPEEGYSMLTSSSLPAVPMFTFVGYVLSESKAGERLFNLSKNVFGWMPGGMVVASILVSVFFATFTGASGVVILALGGLLYIILHKKGNQSEKFTVGLLTGVGDLGLLFPPSLVLILYATTAQINTLDMFKGGVLPGSLTVLVFCIVGVIVSVRRGEQRHELDIRAAFRSLWDSLWEILLPVVILVSFFMGWTTLVETGAVAVLYVVVVEVFIRRELKFADLMRAGVKSAIIMGGVLVILAGAKALSLYIIDTGLPYVLRDWVQANISSKLVFLLLLNLALLVTGMFMDIFSAVLVVVPLILELGGLFDIHPVHLGVIFVANMALGFITPPVGLELFLASYRFGQPIARVYRYVLPFFLLQLGAVLIITYVPWFSTVLVGG